VPAASLAKLGLEVGEDLDCDVRGDGGAGARAEQADDRLVLGGDDLRAKLQLADELLVGLDDLDALPRPHDRPVLGLRVGDELAQRRELPLLGGGELLEDGKRRGREAGRKRVRGGASQGGGMGLRVWREAWAGERVRRGYNHLEEIDVEVEVMRHHRDDRRDVERVESAEPVDHAARLLEEAQVEAGERAAKKMQSRP